MKHVITQIFAWMPVLFGIGFLAPLFAQVVAQWSGASWMAPETLVPSVLVGATSGAYAKWRGSWL